MHVLIWVYLQLSQCKLVCQISVYTTAWPGTLARDMWPMEAMEVSVCVLKLLNYASIQDPTNDRLLTASSRSEPHSGH